MRIAVGSSLVHGRRNFPATVSLAVYVGAALAVKRGGHVRITAQFMFLPTRWRLVFRAVGDIIWIGFSLLCGVDRLAFASKRSVLPRSVAYPRRCEGVGGMHYPVQLQAGELAHR